MDKSLLKRGRPEWTISRAEAGGTRAIPRDRTRCRAGRAVPANPPSIAAGSEPCSALRFVSVLQADAFGWLPPPFGLKSAFAGNGGRSRFTLSDWYLRKLRGWLLSRPVSESVNFTVRTRSLGGRVAPGAS